jgi:DNA topoisomerase-1
MNLVIVESPAKCQKIQGFLGPGWRVIASMGHIRALEEDLTAVGLEADFEPRFQWLKEKGKAIAQLKEAAQGVTKVYLAADDDREGEAIAYSVALLLKLPLATTARAVFHEITEKAVKAAVAKPRVLDMNRVNAQQARAVLDMMIGYTISPLLWKHIAHALSAGRCQTPALRLVVDREREITNFKVSSSWRVKGVWSDLPAAMTEDLEDEESAQNYLENIYNVMEGTVQKAETKPWTEAAPRPLITSTLQQEASALHAMNPKFTMQAAQRLYEAGHITYMRTDKAVISEEAVVAAQTWVREAFGVEYVGGPAAAPAPAAPKKKAKATEVPQTPQAQEAHEAIRPTHFELTELPATEDWSAGDRKVYKLIWNRAVQSVMSTCRGDTRKLIFRAKGDPCEFDWTTAVKRTTFQGWRRLGNTANLDEEEETADAEAELWKKVSGIEAGSVLRWSSLEAYPHETKAAGRFTEATLVRELEKKGIGRPSTFAALLASIQDKKYVEKVNKPAQKVQRTRYKLVPNQWPATRETFEQSMGAEKDKLGPTPLGERVMGFCADKFSDLFDYGFTALMETRLDKIAEGEEEWKKVLRDTWASYKERYETLKAVPSAVVNSERQKEFGDGLKAVQSKKGPLILIEDKDDKENTKFYGWPDGVKWDDLTEEVVRAFVEKKKVEMGGDLVGTIDGKKVEKKKGPFGVYVVWGDVKLSIVGTETMEEIETKLREKAGATLHVLGPFEFRKSQYGIYMFKKDLKEKKFAGVPDGIDIKKLTETEAVKIYQESLKNKARNFTPGGGGRGRGGFRGRGGRGRGRGAKA